MECSSNYVECRCDPPRKCPYRAASGSRFRCNHRNRHVIVDETDRELDEQRDSGWFFFRPAASKAHLVA